MLLTPCINNLSRNITLLVAESREGLQERARDSGTFLLILGHYCHVVGAYLFYFFFIFFQMSENTQRCKSQPALFALLRHYSKQTMSYIWRISVGEFGKLLVVVRIYTQDSSAKHGSVDSAQDCKHGLGAFACKFCANCHQGPSDTHCKFCCRNILYNVCGKWRE